MIQQKNVTGIHALNYVKQQLSRGGVLSDCIRELPLNNGAIYALVPERAPESMLYNFESGGIYPVDEKVFTKRPPSMPIENDTRPLLLQIIQQYLSLRDLNCCLFEDQLRSPMDPVASGSKLEYVHLNGKMFYFFNYYNSEPSIVQKALMASEAHVFPCVLSTLDTAMQNEFSPNRLISLDLLKKFSSGATSFFVNAYDHEGFLMWVKRE